METGVKNVHLKIIVLGESGVGKTCILNKYVKNLFIESHKSTIGADFFTKEIQLNDKHITLQLWDTAGQERFQSLGKAYYRGADAVILVYDITDKISFDKIDSWKKHFIKNYDGNDMNNFPFLLIGNKSDLNDDREITFENGSNYANNMSNNGNNNNNVLFYECSAKNGHQINEAIQAIASKASDNDNTTFYQIPNDINNDTLKYLDEQWEPESNNCYACKLL